jgi:hypothetical protein
VAWEVGGSTMRQLRTLSPAPEHDIRALVSPPCEQGDLAISHGPEISAVSFTQKTHLARPHEGFRRSSLGCVDPRAPKWLSACRSTGA